MLIGVIEGFSRHGLARLMYVRKADGERVTVVITSALRLAIDREGGCGEGDRIFIIFIIDNDVKNCRAAYSVGKLSS